MANVVLVTGGTGFVASHCILQLLQRGYKVRATLRSLDKKNNEKAKMLLGWQPRTNEKALLVTAESLFQFGSIK